MQKPLSMTLTLVLLVSLSLFFEGATSAASVAQFPERPIRMIVPQGIGASTDILARMLAVKFADALGQQMVVDNRSGASGMIGLELAARAAPDGYTLLSTSTGFQVIVPQLRKNLAFDPFGDLTPISLYAVTQNVLVTHPSLPATLQQFIAYAKARSGKLNVASAGTGTQSHLAGVQFKLATGIDAVHVPYKGGGPLVAAVIANESQFSISPLPAYLSHIVAKRVRALGTGGNKRSPHLPDVPTTAEAGVTGFASTGWVGLMAPRGTPRPIFDKLHATLLKVMSDPEVRQLIERRGAEPVTSTPAEFGRFIRAEWDRYGQTIKAAKITAE